MADVLEMNRRGDNTTPRVALPMHKAAAAHAEPYHAEPYHAEPYHAAPSVHDSVSNPTAAAIAIARLRIRMEALEHLVIILLADTNSRDVDAVRGLLNDVPFWTDPSQSAESSRAAAHMIRLVERSDRLRDGPAAGK